MARYDVPPDIKDNIILRYLWDATHERGENIICLINGLPRRGKSFIGLHLAHCLDRGEGRDFEHRFSVPKKCKFTKLDFQTIVRKYDYTGSCPMWDEAGLAEFGAHARQFWSQSNIDMSSLFQVMGHHEQVSIITLPFKIMLDKHLRLLAHVNIQALKVNPTKKKMLCKGMVA